MARSVNISNTDKIGQNIWKYMRKITDKQYNAMSDDERAGVLTDGLDNWYIPRKVGVTEFYQLDISIPYIFRYNFTNGCIEIYIDEDESHLNTVVLDEGGNHLTLLATYNVDIENFADSPKYWTEIAVHTLRDKLDSAVEDFRTRQASEDYAVANNVSNIYYDKQFRVEVNAPEDVDEAGIDETITNYFNSFNMKYNIYGNEIVPEFDYDVNTGILTITIRSDAEISYKDIEDIEREILATILSSNVLQFPVSLNAI